VGDSNEEKGFSELAAENRQTYQKLVLRELYMLQQPGKARALNACISLVTMAMLMRHA